MTTAVSSKPATPASSPAKTIFQGLVKIHTIEVRDQVRKKFDKNAHEELVSSVKAKGIISPITVRPGKTGGRPYILVAGERRLRAALGAGLEQVPVVVRDLDDQAAALYQVEENIHRKDLTPIEEARGFKLLLDAKKFTVEQLAQLVDKSLPYVYRATALLELPKKMLDAIENGELTPAHGHQVLRVPAAKRDEFVKFCFEEDWSASNGELPTAKTLREHIDEELGQDLKDARFPQDKPFAGAIACAGCPSNSGNQGVLFEGVEKGKCLNAPCFEKKEKQIAEDEVAALKAKYPDVKVYRVPQQIWKGQFVAGHTIGDPMKAGQKLKSDQALVISERDGKVFVAQFRKPSKTAASSNEPKPKSERERFIEKAVTSHIKTVVGKAKIAPTEKQMLAATNANYKGRWASAEMKKLLPVTAKNVLRVFFQDLEDGGGIDDEEMAKALDIDLKKETATATKAAETEWMKLHPKSKA